MKWIVLSLLVTASAQAADLQGGAPVPPPVIYQPMAAPTVMQRLLLPSQYASPQTCTGPNCPQAQPQRTGWYLGKVLFGR